MSIIRHLGAWPLVVAGLAPTALVAEEVSVAFGTVWPTFSILEYAEAEGMLDGIDLDVAVLDDPTRGYQMLAAGQVDLVFATLDYAPIAAAAELPISVVAVLDISHGGDQIVLAPGITPDDLIGESVAAAEGFIGQVFLGDFLSQSGLSPNDVTWVNLLPEQVIGPMMSGDIKAAYVYEPWTSNLLESLEGAQVAIDSLDPSVLQRGYIADVIYASDEMIQERPDVLDAVLRGYYAALSAYNADPDRGNQALGEFTQWGATDVGYILGENGKFAVGGMYLVDFDEAARQCGALEGNGPLGQHNGSLESTIGFIEEQWIAQGILDQRSEQLSDVIDCDPLQRMVDSAFRQSLSPVE